MSIESKTKRKKPYPLHVSFPALAHGICRMPCIFITTNLVAVIHGVSLGVNTFNPVVLIPLPMLCPEEAV